MSKYKPGDKFILEVTGVDDSGSRTLYEVNRMEGLFSENVLDKLEKVEDVPVVRGECMNKNIYAIIMENGDVYGVPAVLIADNYAKYYQRAGEDYQGNFDTMMQWFHTGDYEFADWAKNNMNWDDVKEQSFLISSNKKKVDFQEGWVNGEYEYRHYKNERN